jgi:ATPase family associated with various cellular activities (AAA)
MRAINECLSLAAGRGGGYAQSQSPLHVLNWARTAYAQLMTRPVTEWGGVVASNNIPSFKGSNECSTTLAIKAHLAGWVIRNSGDRVLEFECNDVEEEEEGVDELSEMPARPKRRRIDLRVEGMGDYEVESMKGSGPMESFYHKKIFSRANKDTRFSLIVPTEAILWAGPCLSDLAHHLREKNGSVMIPSSDGAFLEVTGKPLVAHSLEELRLDERVEPGNLASTASETPIRLADVAGYNEVRCRIDELIIWPERNSKRLRPTSRSSGILFFGPQGCGKTRWARAIAGELEQEVRLLAPNPSQRFESLL